jgi:hypothetical protein
MKKSDAIRLLGGTVSAAAAAVGVTYQAVDRWPDELPPRIADRVFAALWRKSRGALPDVSAVRVVPEDSEGGAND